MSRSAPALQLDRAVNQSKHDMFRDCFHGNDLDARMKVWCHHAMADGSANLPCLLFLGDRHYSDKICVRNLQCSLCGPNRLGSQPSKTLSHSRRPTTPEASTVSENCFDFGRLMNYGQRHVPLQLFEVLTAQFGIFKTLNLDKT